MTQFVPEIKDPEVVPEVRIYTDEEQAQLNYIGKHKSKNEQMAWRRKESKLIDIVDKKINPIQDKIIELMKEKQEHIDELTEVRKVMTKECIHPVEYLVHNGISITCKFCNTLLSLPRNV